MTGQIIYSVKGESDELKAAVAGAQATFKFFWRELSWEARRIVKSLDMAAVKALRHRSSTMTWRDATSEHHAACDIERCARDPGGVF
ncbi:DUF2314 domain-containing protein [Pseudomonas petrae]|uniref:DUF2314 domain-containing protein n=1 Tax=Pseudomonas petrae TaxID=2912190 RepID=UPI001EF135C3|nr:DUF2314 domain-containing protein [Pseudomonas petrae]MCF7533709.1 DUF2314 domain-containing protein [Pseudomonas petrae]MCF7540158.1 DUF2314 domain-containing protein [Pseudomonas petrae]MCF7558436.1 DUF2314 domain-containing protein [Pseudomonas petrae]